MGFRYGRFHCIGISYFARSVLLEVHYRMSLSFVDWHCGLWPTVIGTVVVVLYRQGWRVIRGGSYQ